MDTRTAGGPLAGSGYARVWPAGAPPTSATFLTYAAHRSTTTTGTIAIHPGSLGPNLQLRNQGSAANYTIDIQGWFVPTTSALPERGPGGRPTSPRFPS